MNYSTVPSNLSFPLPDAVTLNYNTGSTITTPGTFTLKNDATTLSTINVNTSDSNRNYRSGSNPSFQIISYTLAVDNNNKIYIFFRVYVFSAGVYTHYNYFAVYDLTTYASIYTTALTYAITKSPTSPSLRQDAYGNSYFSSYSNTVYTPYLNTSSYGSLLVCVSTIDYSTTTIGMPSGGNSVTGDNKGNLYFTSISTKDITKYNISTATSTTFFSNPSLISGGALISCFIANDGYFYALSDVGIIYKISSNGLTCTSFINANANSMCYNSLNGNIYTFLISSGVGNVYEVTPSAVSTFYRSASVTEAVLNLTNPVISPSYNPYNNSIYWTVYNGYSQNGPGAFYVWNTVFSSSILSFSNFSTSSFVNGNNTLQIYLNGVAYGTPIVINIPCFKQGTKILRMNPETDDEEYVPVETLRRGDLIKTVNHGYKAIELIGSREIPDPLAIGNRSSRLYWFRKSKISGLTEDLCVTGEHCILHKSITDTKKDQVLEHMRDIYITEGHYRVPAFLDDRSEPYADSRPATIWHFALENNNIYHNYGVMANGLLVESSSIHYMYKYSNMELI